MSTPVPGGATGTPDGVRERARRNMDRLGIPAGTDNPTLLALDATPLPGATGTPPAAAELADRLESKAVRLADLLDAAALLRSQEAALTRTTEGLEGALVALGRAELQAERLLGVLAFYADPTLYEVRHGWAGISAEKGARARAAIAAAVPEPRPEEDERPAAVLRIDRSGFGLVVQFIVAGVLVETWAPWNGDTADDLARIVKRLAAAGGPPTPGDTAPECNGVCLWASDVGVAANVVAYADRACPLHGDSAPVGGDTP